MLTNFKKMKVQLSKEHLIDCIDRLGYFAIQFEDISVFYENYNLKLQKNIINAILNKKIPKEWYSSPKWFKVAISLMVKDDYKQAIITRFYTHVKGIPIIIETQNEKHCGKEGHWLETQMGVKHNSNNEPDIYGYEMKKSSSYKTTLGDFSASEYIFSKKRNNITTYNNIDIQITRNEFIHYFGSPNLLKNNRYSWSGKCVPVYGVWNAYGQKIIINENDDIIIYYSFKNDKRLIKDSFPYFLKSDSDIVIVLWNAEKMRKNIENKFNKKGFFICKKIDNVYQTISFGKPFTFKYFIECIKNKKIIFDSGMYEGNVRNYSQFRGNVNSFWDELITEEYQ